jgi:hypothetical protein
VPSQKDLLLLWPQRQSTTVVFFSWWGKPLFDSIVSVLFASNGPFADVLISGLNFIFKLFII